MNFKIDRYFTIHGYGFDNDFLENLKNQSNIKELKNNSKEFFDYLCIDEYGMCECTKKSARRWLNRKIIKSGEI